MMNALKHTLLPLLLCGVIAPFVSAAVPLQMPLQGVLRDNAGAPVVEGEFEMTFSIYADAESEESVWTETRMVTAQGGQFRLNLGTETPLSASMRLSSCPATASASSTRSKIWRRRRTTSRCMLLPMTRRTG